MLDTRDYMRQADEGDHWWLRHPAWLQIIAALVVVFVLDQMNAVYFRIPYQQWLYLTPQALRHGYVWQLITFQFFHGGFLHLLCNCLGIFFFGRLVESRLGRGSFLKIYFLSGVVGGILQALMGWMIPHYFGGATVGASAGLFGIIAAFAMIDPGAEIYIYGLIPVKIIYFLYFEIAVSLFFTLVPSESGVAHTAHLGGILFALAYMRMDTPEWWYRLRQKLPSLPAKSPRQQTVDRAIQKVRAATAASAPKAAARANTPLSPQEFISSEVDPILDKISAHGIQSLTEKERDILQKARNKMSKR